MNNDSALSNSGYQVDQILGGRYRVLSVLGKGGMGIVLRVEQIFLGKEFALKTIDKNLLSEVTIRRFQQEAKANFAVSHPNIISVNDFGLLDDETPFMVMEIVSGKTLSTRLKETTSLPIEEAIPIFIQVCFGLAHAHESGIVHRDIKPSNIMLPDPNQTPAGAVKILDFGIAKFTQDGGESQALTKTGEIFGSPLYMSPEQCSGAKVDHRSDVYSLGCVLFETLTGTPPFIGETALSTMMKHQSAPIPTLKEASLGGEFPKDLERMVLAMLAKNPNDRYQNLGITAHDLASIIKADGQAMLSKNIPASTPSPHNSHKLITISRKSFLLLVLVVAIVSSLFSMLALNLFQRIRLKAQNTEPPKVINFVVPDIKNSKIFEPLILAQENRYEIELIATDENLQAFRGYQHAQILNLKGCTVTDKGIAFLQDSKILQLSLVECAIRSVHNIVKLSYLQNLDLRANQITDESLKELAKLKMLKYLNIQETNVTEKGILNLAASNSLVGIFLPEEKFSESAIRRMKKMMPFCSFYSYGRDSYMEELERASKITDEFEKYSHLYSIAKQINPNHSSLANYLTKMGLIRHTQGKKDEANKYFRLANEILLKNGNLANLPSGLLREMTGCVEENEIEKISALADRAAELSYDTLPHDSPDLVQSLMVISNYPRPKEDADKVVNYCQTAINLIEQFPNRQDRKALTALYEKAGWTYYLANQNPKALTYFQKNVTLLRHETPRNDLLFARAILELGHTLPEFTERKSAYDEGMELLEKLNFPEDYNLKEHYCDACSALHDLYIAQGNRGEAAKYLRKAIACLRQIKHPDTFNRAVRFKRLLREELKTPAH